MNRNRPAIPLVVLAAALLIMLVFCWRMQAAGAAPQAPLGCVAHTTFVRGGADHPGDYRCAGTAIHYHTAGVGRSPFPIWAGQWLLVDEAGNFRRGWCTLNRGIHPTINGQSTPVAQALPNDLDGSKSAYLTWRYGPTFDDGLATGLWAVFHFYAQDAAGSNRASNASSPLVPALARLSEASGRQDLEDLAISLDAEAARMAGPFSIDVTLAEDGTGTARVHSHGLPVPFTTVTLTAEGAAFDDESHTATLFTGDDGSVAFEIVGPPQTATVVATTTSPGRAQVYRSAAADPVGHVPQLIITPGTPAAIEGRASVVLVDLTPTTTTAPPETTTVEVTTTTEAVPETTTVETTTTVPETTTTVPETTVPETTTTVPETTVPETTTTVPETTTTEMATTTTEMATTTTQPEVIIPVDTLGPTLVPPPDTIPPDTTPPETSAPETTAAPTTSEETTTTPPETTTTVPVTVEQAPPVPEIVPETDLPHTGSSNAPAYLGTALLVAGVGLVGVVRRRINLASSAGQHGDFW